MKSLKLLLLLAIFLSSSIISIAQTKEIILLDANTKEPISNVSVKLEKSNAGTISQNNGKAKLNSNSNGEIKLSHINYKPETIQAKDIHETLTIYLKPRSTREIEEILIKIPLDNKWIGKWQLESIRSIYLDNNGNVIGKSNKSHSNNIKEYKLDRSFIITNGAIVQLHGNYTTNQSQVFEKIEFAKDNFLKGITNILTYFPHNKKKNRMIVQYQLPNQKNIVEEIWRKMK